MRREAITSGEYAPRHEGIRNHKLVLFAQGQGNLEVGMGVGLADRSPAAKNVLIQADETLRDLLGFNISDLLREGPKDLLNQTDVAQPAAAVGALMSEAALIENGIPINAEWFAGNSFGLLIAARNAGSLTDRGLLRLAAKRGKALRYACSLEETTLAATRGLPIEELQERIKTYEARNGLEDELKLCLVNVDRVLPVDGVEDLNKLQIVIGGRVTDVQRLRQEQGLVDKITPLTVDGAFHHPKYMNPAVPLWIQALEEEAAEIYDPIQGVLIGNTRPVPLGTRDEVVREFKDQFTNPVLHAEGMRFLFLYNGAGEMLELAANPRFSNMNKDMFGGQRPERIATPSIGEGDRGVTIAQSWRAAA